MRFERVGVVGCGIMGGGIAQICAQAGYAVTVIEADAGRLETGMRAIEKRLARDVERGRTEETVRQAVLTRLQSSTEITDLSDCDLVIEAIVEELDPKLRLFEQLGAVCKPDAILASNTSSLSLSALAGVSGRPERVIGLHFFNPPTALRLVEVVTSQSTSQESLDASLAFCESLDRVIVRTGDSPGFIVNRLLVPFILDAIRMVEAGTATVADIDEACRGGLSHAMGPLATADLIGLDTLVGISESMFDEFGEARFKAPAYLRRLVSLGRLGRKSGCGFYEYQPVAVA